MSPNKRTPIVILNEIVLCAICLSFFIFSAMCYAEAQTPIELAESIPVAVQAEEVKQEVIIIQQEAKEEEAEAKKVKAIADEAARVAKAKAEAAKPKPIYEQRLGKELTDYTIKMCKNYGVDPKLVFAVMKVESNYVVDAVSSNGQDYGLMQINISNHSRLKRELKISNLLDAKSNIFAGVYMLAGIQGNNYNSVHQVLMVYNQGGSSAKTSWGNGAYSSKYSRTIVDIMKSI